LARSGPSVLTVFVTLVAAVSARATGALETDGATKLSVGAAPHPGFVIVDSYAPTGTPPSLGTVAAPAPLGAPPAGPPAFDAGPGGPALAYSGTVTLPGGAYDCSTFSAAKNSVVTFTGPTTIRATQYVVCQGRVQTLGDDQPLTIVSGGTLQCGSPNNSGSTIATVGARSDLTLQCGADYMEYAAPFPPRVYAAQSSVHVRAWSVSAAPNGLAAGLDVDVVAGGDINLYGRVDSEIPVPMGGLVVNAGRDAAFRSALGNVYVTGAEVSVAGRLTIDAGQGVAFDNEKASVHADGGIDVSAYGGAIDVKNGALVLAGKTGAVGASTWRARDGIFVAGRSTYGYPSASTYVACASERFVLQSTAGNVEIGMDGAPTPPHLLDATGSIEMRAAGTVRVRATGRVTSKSGATMTGLAGVALDAGASIDAGAGALVAASPETVSIAAGASAVGGSVSLWSPKLVAVAAGAGVEATAGSLLVTAHDATFNGTGTAFGDLRISTLGGVADVRGATLSTRDATSGPSGVVEVVAYPGPGAALLAQGATLRSGSSATASGDVVLRVVVPLVDGGYPPGGGGTTPATTRGDPPFVVPASVVVKARRRSSAQDLTLRGFVDLGTTDALAPGAASVSIGDVEFAATLVVARTGAATARGSDVVVVIGRPRAGSPRRTVTIRAREAFLPADLSGDLPIVLKLGSVNAPCRVRVDDGRFDLRRGALVEPKLHVAGVKPLKNGLVRVTLGLPSNTMAQTEAPNLVLELAGSRWYVERTQLLARRGGFAATSPAERLALVTVDPRARTIDVDVVADALALSPVGGPLEIALRVNGGATRLLRVVVGTARGKLVY